MIKNKKRKIIFVLFGLFLAACCTLLCTLFVKASWFKSDDIPIPTVKKDVYVYDEDSIIEDNIEIKLNTLLIQLEEKTGAEVVVITVESLLDMEIEDYSYELANTLGIGKAEDDNGILLLISKTDKRVRLEIGRGLEGCLNDSKCGRILDNYFVPYRENNEYSEGTYKTIEAVVSVIANEYEVTIGEVDDTLANQLEEEEKEQTRKTIKLLIIIIIILIVLFVCDQTFLGGAILDCLLGGGSSGGFSGGGSSRGGFGGGSFGGGGASR